MAEQLSVGSTIWRYDFNRRVYERDPHTGRQIGGPIFAEHFVPEKIIGETKLSWLTGDGWNNVKVSKSTLAAAGGVRYFTDESRRRAIWCRENGKRLAGIVTDAARGFGDYALLIAVDETIRAAETREAK